MPDPVFFIIQRKPGGGDFPALCFEIPPALLRKIPKGAAERPELVYALRLDLLTSADRDAWGWTLADMHRTYCEKRDAGTLPASNLNPPRQDNGGARRLLGEHWQPPAKTWDDSRPPDSWPGASS